MISLDQGIRVARDLGLTVYTHDFGSSSNANMDGVFPPIVLVCRLAIKLCRYDGTVVSGGGLRTDAEAQANQDNGSGIFDSRHKRQNDGLGHAIDCVPYVSGAASWKMKPAIEMAAAVKLASAILKVPIRQGCDWNLNGVLQEINEHDICHLEDPKQKYMAAAIAEMNRYRRELELDELGDETLESCECPECGSRLVLNFA